MASEEDKDRRTLGRDPLTGADDGEWDSIWKVPETPVPGGPELSPPPAPEPPPPPPKAPAPPAQAAAPEAQVPPAAEGPVEKSAAGEPAPPPPAPAKAPAAPPPPRPAEKAAQAPPRPAGKRTSTRGPASERSAARAEGPTHIDLEPGQVLQAVGFQVADEHFCVPLEKTQEIIRYQETSAVPDSPPFVEGIINLRGRVIPVISVRKRFSITDIEPTRQTRIVILHVSGAGVVGLVVDSVSEVIRITADNLMDTSTFSSTHMDYIHGLSQIGDRLHIILDVDRLLSTAEKEVFVTEGLGEG